MQGPFPGMDPYLEQHWGDVHATFMVYAKRQLNDQLPPDLQARVEESLSVATDGAETRYIYPDVRVVEDEPVRWSHSPSISTAVVAEPTKVLCRARVESSDTSKSSIPAAVKGSSRPSSCSV